MSKKTIKFQRSKKDHKFCKADWIILLTIMIIYSAIALYNLGYHYAPQTAWKGTDGQNIVLDMGDVTDIGNVSFFMGETAYYNLSVSGRDSTSDMWESYNSIFVEHRKYRYGSQIYYDCPVITGSITERSRNN